MVFAKREPLLPNGFVLLGKITRLLPGLNYPYFLIFGLLNLPAFPGINYHPTADIGLQVMLRVFRNYKYSDEMDVEGI